MSQHPVDLLIRDRVDTGRDATTAEIAAIIARIAAAPLYDGVFSVPVDERGARYAGITLGRKVRADEYHLVKRVAIEQQWGIGTTAREYLDDIHAAAQHPATRLSVYKRRGGYLAATITPREVVVPFARLGPRPFPFVLVVYSADRGTIVTGYQIETVDTAAIPGDAQWLK